MGHRGINEGDVEGCSETDNNSNIKVLGQRRENESETEKKFDGRAEEADHEN